jgi:hypothetical protein
MMILGAAIGLVLGPITWPLVPHPPGSQFPWISFALAWAAIVVLHPVMDKEVPTLIGADMLKSVRTYIGAGLLIGTQFVDFYYYRLDSWSLIWRSLTDRK